MNERMLALMDEARAETAEMLSTETKEGRAARESAEVASVAKLTSRESIDNMSPLVLRLLNSATDADLKALFNDD